MGRLRELLARWGEKAPLLGAASPPEGWSPAKKAGFWLWNALWLLLAAAGLTLCSLFLAKGPYPMAVLKGYFEVPLILVLNFLPIALLLLLLYGAVGRSWLAFLLTSGVVLGFSAANYFKLLFRDDPLLFGDLLLVKEAGNMAGQYSVAMDWKLALCIGAALAGTVFLFFCARGRPCRWGRVGCALAALLAAVLLSSTYLSEETYYRTAHYDHLNNIWSPTQQYLARGFLYPFLHSASDAFPTPPAGYDEAEAAALLGQYADADIPEEEKVNVVAVMLEAFCDLSQYPQIQFASDVYGYWHALSAESYTGSLTTDIFAGGTITSEHQFLTGCSDLDTYRTYTNSHVWYFKSQGYQTLGDHPFNGWFYNRRNVNGYLGFDSYRFLEEHYGALAGGGIAMDDIFFPELLASCQSAMEEEAPLFSFSVTYQGHGPYYNNWTAWGGLGDFVAGEGYTLETWHILENYFGSVSNTLTNLEVFVDGLRREEEPVVLILFGDHKPWMGDGNSVYTELGISFDMSTGEGLHNYYDTPYLIWANDAAKEALGFNFVGEGPNLGPYHLMSHIFELCGWEGSAFMQASRTAAEVVPVLSVTGMYVEGGALVGALTEENAALVRDYRMMQYYWSRNFRYQGAAG